ncbi:MAG: hypothetical protein KDA84_29145 [Planctomycetaceae bacterium]|nr:hypothetical protein [Planctomycetaceae bacterium]
MKQILDRLQEKQDERQHCINVLYLWDQIAAQGIDHTMVKSFGFNSAHLKGQDRKAFVAHQKFRGTQMTRKDGTRYIQPSHFTYVRLKDDSIVILDPILKRPE